MMLFFPMFLPLVQAGGLASTIVYGGIVLLAIENRKYILWNKLLFPILIYTGCSIPMVCLASTGTISNLKIYFAVFIVLVGIYNLLGIIRPDKIQIKINPFTTILCAGLSGVGTGLFGIGGPPMATYFMAVAGENKAAYIGTIQAFFAFSMVFSLTTRFVTGVMTVELLPLAGVGFIASMLGKWWGTKALTKINAMWLKIGICVFMILSGIVNLL